MCNSNFKKRLEIAHLLSHIVSPTLTKPGILVKKVMF